MRLALHVHYRPFSVTSEESLRHSVSEPPLMDTRAPRTGDFFLYENFALSKETYIAKKKPIRVMPPQGML